jgi:hypothetical protein
VTLTLDSSVVVRLHLRTSRVEAGRLVAPFAPDSVVFRYCRYPAPPCQVGSTNYAERLARDVTAVDIRTGTQTATGALLGGLVGAGVAALGIAFASSFEEDVTTGQILGISFFSLGIFGGVGAGIGSGISNWGPAP